MPFAPPKFIEPTYGDCYQDTMLPLNDNEHIFDPENSACWVFDDEPLNRIPNAGPLMLQASTPIPQFPSSQQIPSPRFLSDVYPSSGSPAFNPAFLDNASSDDFALPTPTHTNVDFATPKKDQIKDVLQNKHSFVTSVYASSPTGSFRGFPLDVLVGSRDSSPFAHSGLSSAAGLGEHQTNLVPVALLQPARNPGRLGGNAHTSVKPRSVSSDIYKAKLLAYATTVVDHMSSSGDEASALDSWMGTRGSPETPELGPTAGHNVSAPQVAGYTSDERIAAPQFPGYNLGDARVVTKGSLVTQDELDGDVISRANLMAVDQQPIRTLDIIPETNSEPISPEDHLFSTGLEGHHSVDSGLFEDWENESTEDNFEETGELDSKYELMQAEYDTLAADEPSDEEVETYMEPINVSQIGAGVKYLVPRPADAITASEPDPSKPKTNIRPFPMNISRRASNRDLTPETTDANETKLTRLSPKFAPRSVKHFHPNPFAALLRRRFGTEKTLEVGGRKVQESLEDLEDDIESWPA